ncbi:dentin sialophosphoprotein-like [Bolinopsis microptera]|uniref:dentin sialophosphoprotein-like n=1 Tax=Bolinopsis microptera TaxID=2820187 RepID=UPI00307A2DC5
MLKILLIVACTTTLGLHGTDPVYEKDVDSLLNETQNPILRKEWESEKRNGKWIRLQSFKLNPRREQIPVEDDESYYDGHQYDGYQPRNRRNSITKQANHGIVEIVDEALSIEKQNARQKGQAQKMDPKHLQVKNSGEWTEEDNHWEFDETDPSYRQMEEDSDNDSQEAADSGLEENFEEIVDKEVEEYDTEQGRQALSIEKQNARQKGQAQKMDPKHLQVKNPGEWTEEDSHWEFDETNPSYRQMEEDSDNDNQETADSGLEENFEEIVDKEVEDYDTEQRRHDQDQKKQDKKHGSTSEDHSNRPKTKVEDIDRGNGGNIKSDKSEKRKTEKPSDSRRKNDEIKRKSSKNEIEKPKRVESGHMPEHLVIEDEREWTKDDIHWEYDNYLPDDYEPNTDNTTRSELEINGDLDIDTFDIDGAIDRYNDIDRIDTNPNNSVVIDEEDESADSEDTDDSRDGIDDSDNADSKKDDDSTDTKDDDDGTNSKPEIERKSMIEDDDGADIKKDDSTGSKEDDESTESKDSDDNTDTKDDDDGTDSKENDENKDSDDDDGTDDKDDDKSTNSKEDDNNTDGRQDDDNNTDIRKDDESTESKNDVDNNDSKDDDDSTDSKEDDDSADSKENDDNTENKDDDDRTNSKENDDSTDSKEDDDSMDGKDNDSGTDSKPEIERKSMREDDDGAGNKEDDSTESKDGDDDNTDNKEDGDRTDSKEGDDNKDINDDGDGTDDKQDYESTNSKEDDNSTDGNDDDKKDRKENSDRADSKEDDESMNDDEDNDPYYYERTEIPYHNGDSKEKKHKPEIERKNHENDSEEEKPEEYQPEIERKNHKKEPKPHEKIVVDEGDHTEVDGVITIYEKEFDIVSKEIPADKEIILKPASGEEIRVKIPLFTSTTISSDTKSFKFHLSHGGFHGIQKWFLNIVKLEKNEFGRPTFLNEPKEYALDLKRHQDKPESNEAVTIAEFEPDRVPFTFTAGSGDRYYEFANDRLDSNQYYGVFIVGVVYLSPGKKVHLTTGWVEDAHSPGRPTYFLTKKGVGLTVHIFVLLSIVVTFGGLLLGWLWKRNKLTVPDTSYKFKKIKEKVKKKSNKEKIKKITNIVMPKLFKKNTSKGKSKKLGRSNEPTSSNKEQYDLVSFKPKGHGQHEAQITFNKKDNNQYYDGSWDDESYPQDDTTADYGAADYNHDEYDEYGQMVVPKGLTLQRHFVNETELDDTILNMAEEEYEWNSS